MEKSMKKIYAEAELLQEGDVMLSCARRVANGKVQLEFLGRVQGGTINLIGLMNKSDSRFNSSNLTRAWFAGEEPDIKDMYGIELDDATLEEYTTKKGETYQVYPLGVINPVAYGYKVSLQIQESTIPNKNQRANPETTIKKNGRGQFLATEDGLPIYRNTTIVGGHPKNTFKQHAQIFDSIEEFAHVETLEAEEV